jgi:hypothetical protein
MEGHGAGPWTKNGPALGGHGAEAVRDAIASSIMELPEYLRRALTWEQGAEMAQHAQQRVDTGSAIYFCDHPSPWQYGTDENTNGLLRQYFPKGTDLSKQTLRDLGAVAAALNGRPRKTLGWRTPAEALDEYPLSCQKGSVARTSSVWGLHFVIQLSNKSRHGSVMNLRVRPHPPRVCRPPWSQGTNSKRTHRRWDGRGAHDEAASASEDLLGWPHGSCAARKDRPTCL